MHRWSSIVISVLACVSSAAWAQTGGEAPGTLQGQRVLAGDGSSAAPSYALSNAPGVGFYRRRDGDGQGLLFAAGGKRGVIAFTSQTLALESAHELVWSSVANVDNLNTHSNDVRLGRDGRGVLRLTGGTAPGIRIYSAWTGSSDNFARFAIITGLGSVALNTEASGSGVLAALELGTGANAKWVFDQRGNFGRGAKTPAAQSCGTSAQVQGRDSGMVVTVGGGGTASTCTIQFGAQWGSAPSCVANSDTDPAPLTVSTTHSAVTVGKSSAFTAGSRLHIHCLGV